MFVSLIILMSVTVKAQTSHKDYFVDKWDVAVVGTLVGD